MSYECPHGIGLCTGSCGKIASCQHTRVERGLNEYETDRCADCFVPIFQQRSDLAGLAAHLSINIASTPEPAPIANSHPACWELVIADVEYLIPASKIRDQMIADMQERDRFGLAKYKTRLQPFNTRNPVIDAYQESLDLCVYLRQALFEHDRASLNTAYKHALASCEILRREMNEASSV